MTPLLLIPSRPRLLILKLLFSSIVAVATASAAAPLPMVEAQTATGSFPGKLVAEGVWSDIRAGHRLIPLEGDFLLDWEPVTGRYRLWPVRLDATPPAPLLTAQALGQGITDLAGPNRELIYLGDNRLLAREPASGQYQVWPVVATPAGTITLGATQTVAQGSLHDVEAGDRVIYLGSGKVLIWEPATGQYRVWRYDPTLTGQIDAFPGELLGEGIWPDIQAGHELVYLGLNRLLDWEPATGQYRIWRYDPMVRGAANPLRGQPLAEGLWGDPGPEQALISLSHNRLLAWEPASGRYRLWQYDLNAVAAFSLEDIAAKLDLQTITGVTVVTHGFQLTNDAGNALEPLAQDIHQKAGGWLLDYTVADDGENGAFEACTNDCGAPALGEQGLGELVLLFDWAPESNELSDGWGEAAGDALFSMLVGLGLVNPATPNNTPPLHFIAHSFGSAVTSEAVERLAAYGVPVDHLTYLDPHDFDQGNIPVDESQKLFELGQPSNYGATVWDNVTFADVYYQTQFSLFVDPEGRPIPGAYNWSLNDLIDANIFVIGPHTYVWQCFYRGTVIGQKPAGCDTPLQPVDYSQTGYAFGRIKNTASRPAPNFYSNGQDHFHSNPELVDTTTGLPNAGGLANLGLTEAQVNQGRWTPNLNNIAPIVNGNFEKGGSGCLLSCIKPGWSHHGGGGTGHFDADQSMLLELDAGDTIRSHNWFYLPPNATALQFDLWRELVISADSLEVRLGNQTVASFDLDQDDGEFIPQTVAVPPLLPGQTITLTYEIEQVGLLVGSQARIDNIDLPGAGPSPPDYLVYLPNIVVAN